VHCYTYKVDTLISKQSESTDVYFYNDIVSISTSTDTSNINNVNREYESFVLVTKGGTKLKVAIRNKDEAQRSINAMRSLLRTKKHD
jgi:sulfur relay (sulfurtransferase) complex TusBCD TusD component (DsrE family)